MRHLIIAAFILLAGCTKVSNNNDHEIETSKKQATRRGFIEKDGEYLEIQLDHFDPNINYGKVIIIDEDEVKNQLKPNALKGDEEFEKKKAKLSQQTLNDFNYIKEKMKEGEVLRKVASFAPFKDLFGMGTSLTDLWDIYSTIADNDWEEVGLFIARDIPRVIKSTLYNEVNLIAFKYIAGSLRTKEDAAFWEKIVNMFGKEVDVYPLLGTYSGSTYYYQSNSMISVSFKITLKNKMYWGVLNLENSGVTNVIENYVHFNQGKVLMLNPHYTTNTFSGIVSDDYKKIKNFASVFRGTLWVLDLTK